MGDFSRAHWKAMLPFVEAWAAGKLVLLDGCSMHLLSFGADVECYTFAHGAPHKDSLQNRNDWKSKLPFVRAFAEGKEVRVDGVAQDTIRFHPTDVERLSLAPPKRCTREHWKAMLPIIEAWIGGKAITLGCFEPKRTWTFNATASYYTVSPQPAPAESLHDRQQWARRFNFVKAYAEGKPVRYKGELLGETVRFHGMDPNAFTVDEPPFPKVKLDLRSVAMKPTHITAEMLRATAIHETLNAAMAETLQEPQPGIAWFIGEYFGPKPESKPPEFKTGDYVRCKFTKGEGFIGRITAIDNMRYNFSTGHVDQSGVMLTVRYGDKTRKVPIRYAVSRVTFRPFANAAEFSPYRDKWVVDKDGITKRCTHYADERVGYTHRSYTYKDALDGLTFADTGLPFGIPVDER